MSDFLSGPIQKAGSLLHIGALQNYGTAPAAPADGSASIVAAKTPTTTSNTSLIIGGLIAVAVAVWVFIKKGSKGGRKVKFK
jgi:hypothetical protein